MYQVRIDDIIVARSDAVTAEPLPPGLAKNTYTEPLIIRDDMILVDGLRRLLWHRTQGHEKVPAVRVHDFMEAMEALTPLHQDRTLTPLRIWNMVSSLRDWELEWSRNKYTGGWTKDADGNHVRTVPRQRPPKDSENSARLQYRRSCNITQHTLQSALFIYKRAEAGDERAQELAARAEAGEISIIQANRLYASPNNLVGHVTDQAEQLRILERGVLGLEAQVAGLQKLGHPLTVSSEDISKALDGLVETRTAMTRMILGFRNILKERNG